MPSRDGTSAHAQHLTDSVDRDVPSSGVNHQARHVAARIEVEGHHVVRRLAEKPEFTFSEEIFGRFLVFLQGQVTVCSGRDESVAQQTAGTVVCTPTSHPVVFSSRCTSRAVVLRWVVQ